MLYLIYFHCRTMYNICTGTVQYLAILEPCTLSALELYNPWQYLCIVQYMLWPCTIPGITCTVYNLYTFIILFLAINI